MSNYLNIIEKDKCTGCGACKQVCPFGAITMLEDVDGYVFPVLDEAKCTNCGLCKKTCHILNAKFNKAQKACYAVMANDKIRMSSSSGGIFSVVAEYVLRHKGYVCGAVFNKDWNVEHIIIDDIKDLDKLRRSKYVQSDLKDTFKEIKKLLKNGKFLLFVGTPCQVAALNCFLNKDYNNLITMDLVCHGTPNAKIWQKFLSDNVNKDEIIDIKFRDKKENGWDPYLGTINTSIYTRNANNVFKTYMQAYCTSLSTRSACCNCNYTKVERCADITVCDFWYISKYEKGLDDKKGTSFLMMNTSKAQKLFKNLKKEFKLFKKMDIDIYDYSYYNNHHMARRAIEHKHKPFFLKDLREGKNFNDVVARWVKQTHDVGLVGFYSGINYGTQLQYYSLYQTINDLGYSVLMINNPLNASVYPRRKMEMFQVDPYRPQDRAEDFANKEAMRRLNNLADRFIAGSDQYFRPSIYKRMGEYVALDWVYDFKQKYGYAISFAVDYFEGDEYTRANMHYLLNKFDDITVRENSAIKLLKDNFNLDAKVCVDPVFLLNKKYINSFIDRSKIETKNKYILSYILDRTPEKTDVINAVKEKMGLDLESIEDPVPLFLSGKMDILIEDWLKYYQNADFVITDSFHGMCMALIFNKQFMYFSNKLRGASRFTTLEEIFDVSGRQVDSVKDIDRILQSQIDYKKVNEKIEYHKQDSLNYLKKILSERKIKPISTYDVLMDNKCNSLSKEIRFLKDYIKLQKKAGYYKFKYEFYRLLLNLINNKTIKAKKMKYKARVDFLNSL